MTIIENFLLTNDKKSISLCLYEPNMMAHACHSADKRHDIQRSAYTTPSPPLSKQNKTEAASRICGFAGFRENPLRCISDERICGLMAAVPLFILERKDVEKTVCADAGIDAGCGSRPCRAEKGLFRRRHPFHRQRVLEPAGRGRQALCRQPAPGRGRSPDSHLRRRR